MTSPLKGLASAAILLSMLGMSPARADDPAAPAEAITKAARPHHVYLVGNLLVSRSWIDADDRNQEGIPVYLMVENRSGVPDYLVGASIDGAGPMALAQQNGEPAGTGGLIVPAHGTLLLQPGGPHLTMPGGSTPPDPNAPVAGVLRFAIAGPLRLSFATSRSELDGDDQTAPTADKPAELQQ